jgi:threonine/homoserine/homoserine lactone efflux protein
LESVAALAGIVGALLLGAISPGPSFVLVARTSIAVSRREGLASALGMGIGGVFLGSLALLGLRTLLMQVTWLYLCLKAVGGLYLIYLGIRLWRGASEPIAAADGDERAAARPGKSFGLGLATQLSNPKTAVVYASIFAALLPAKPPGWMWVALPPLIFAVEAGWYAVVALLFSSAACRLSALETLDRSACRRGAGRARRATDRRCGATRLASGGDRLIRRRRCSWVMPPSSAAARPSSC